MQRIVINVLRICASSWSSANVNAVTQVAFRHNRCRILLGPHQSEESLPSARLLRVQGNRNYELRSIQTEDLLYQISQPKEQRIYRIRTIRLKQLKGTTITLKLRVLLCLTFKNLASYIQDERTATLQMLHFIYIFATNISTEYFNPQVTNVIYIWSTHS